MKSRIQQCFRDIGRKFGTFRGLRSLGNRRAAAAFAHDVSMAGAAFVISLILKSGAAELSQIGFPITIPTLCFTVVAASVFCLTGMSRSLWCYASIGDMLTIVKSATMAVALFALVCPLLHIQARIQLETLAITWLVLIAMLSGPRIIDRLVTDRRSAIDENTVRGREPLLLIGAGDGTELFLRALARDQDTNHRVVGIVDEMGTHLRRHIHGVEVLGAVDQLEKVVDELERRGSRPSRLVITEDNLSPVAMRAMLDQAESLGLTLSRIPRLTELRSGVNDKVEVKPIAIDDLLGRPQAVLDRPSMAALCRGARVLVTGAGGTIGSELVRQITDFEPAFITLVDSSELHLYQIDMELSERQASLQRHAVIADVRDGRRIEEVFAEDEPELVFHAAAMKHVPIVELNPCEGVRTNVIGTRNVADACVKFGVRAMVLVSTDKAVNPTNVMGATKRVAESYCQALDIETVRRSNTPTRFITVRFGNVLGSTGSVVPLFQHQLAMGGPLTVNRAVRSPGWRCRMSM